MEIVEFFHFRGICGIKEFSSFLWNFITFFSGKLSSRVLERRRVTLSSFSIFSRTFALWSPPAMWRVIVVVSALLSLLLQVEQINVLGCCGSLARHGNSIRRLSRVHCLTIFYFQKNMEIMDKAPKFSKKHGNHGQSPKIFKKTWKS